MNSDEMNERMIRLEVKLDNLSESMEKMDKRLDGIEGQDQRITRLEERQSYNSRAIHTIIGVVGLLFIETAIVLLARFMV